MHLFISRQKAKERMKRRRKEGKKEETDSDSDSDDDNADGDEEKSKSVLPSAAVEQSGLKSAEKVEQTVKNPTTTTSKTEAIRSQPPKWSKPKGAHDQTSSDSSS